MTTDYQASHPQDVLPPEEEPTPLPRSENELRQLLGLPAPEERMSASTRRWGWLVTALSGLLAAALRLVGLGHPSTLMFDEIYYVKDAYALSQLGYEANWGDDANTLFAQGDFSAMTDEASYVVHPSLGKWLIAGGEWLFGAGDPVGWRFAAALCGILTVMLLVRLTLRLTRSPLLAGLAGLLLSIDGVAITESRIGLLDIFLGFFALLAVYFLIRDREWFRERLATKLAGTLPGASAPTLGLRPWLIASGVSLGLACSVKWSGLYLMAVLGIVVVGWDVLALRRVQCRGWFVDGLVRHGVGDFWRLVPVGGLVYVASWFSWFTHPNSYKRGWAAAERAANGTVARSWLPDILNDWVEYHRSIYQFHVGLDSEHPYQALPAGWLLQMRPTSFYWPSDEEMGARATSCGADRCVEAITSIGNIPIWWAAFIALFVVILLGTVGRDWRAWVVLSGYLGLYAPWFLYPERTIFTFYTVTFVPFVVLALVLALGLALGVVQPAFGVMVQQGLATPSKLGRALGFCGAAPAGLPATSPKGATSAEAPAPEPPLDPYEVLPTPGHRLAIVASQTAHGRKTGPTNAFTGVPRGQLQRVGLLLTGVIVACALVFAGLWWPIWTGQTVSYDFWYWHMWIPSWI